MITCDVLTDGFRRRRTIDRLKLNAAHLEAKTCGLPVRQLE
jgi:hypothetical protein